MLQISALRAVVKAFSAEARAAALEARRLKSSAAKERAVVSATTQPRNAEVVPKQGPVPFKGEDFGNYGERMQNFSMHRGLGEAVKPSSEIHDGVKAEKLGVIRNLTGALPNTRGDSSDYLTHQGYVFRMQAAPGQQVHINGMSRSGDVVPFESLRNIPVHEVKNVSMDDIMRESQKHHQELMH